MLANHVFTMERLWAVDPSPSKLGIIAWVALPCALGLGIWLYAQRRPAASWTFRLRWSAFIPLIVGIVNGAILASRSLDPAYREYHLIGRNMVAMHWAALIAPLICAVILAAFALMGQARQRRDF
jgi:hypothetical protein